MEAVLERIHNMGLPTRSCYIWSTSSSALADLKGHASRVLGLALNSFAELDYCRVLKDNSHPGFTSPGNSSGQKHTLSPEGGKRHYVQHAWKPLLIEMRGLSKGWIKVMTDQCDDHTMCATVPCTSWDLSLPILWQWEKRCCALGRAFSFPSWPKAPNSWKVWAPGPCVLTTILEREQGSDGHLDNC